MNSDEGESFHFLSRGVAYNPLNREGKCDTSGVDRLRFHVWYEEPSSRFRLFLRKSFEAPQHAQMGGPQNESEEDDFVTQEEATYPTLLQERLSTSSGDGDSNYSSRVGNLLEAQFEESDTELSVEIRGYICPKTSRVLCHRPELEPKNLSISKLAFAECVSALEDGCRLRQAVHFVLEHFLLLEKSLSESSLKNRSSSSSSSTRRSAIGAPGGGHPEPPIYDLNGNLSSGYYEEYTEQEWMEYYGYYDGQQHGYHHDQAERENGGEDEALKQRHSGVAEKVSAIEAKVSAIETAALEAEKKAAIEAKKGKNGQKEKSKDDKDSENDPAAANNDNIQEEGSHQTGPNTPKKGQKVAISESDTGNTHVSRLTSKSSARSEKLSKSGSSSKLFFILISLLALILRCCAGQHRHSGEKTPPMYGDFEAQRHWVEIARHVPLEDWYQGRTKGNDLNYWGLDYPPLTAFHALFMSMIFDVLKIPKNYFAWVSSHGNEDSVVLMRLTVLISDVLIYFGACFIYCSKILKTEKVDGRIRVLSYFLLTTAGPFLLIDHAHFQYNCIALGFLLHAVNAIYYRYVHVGAFLYCLALLYKQTMLYFAPAFFIHLLSLSVYDEAEEIVFAAGKTPVRHRSWVFSAQKIKILKKVAKLGAVVIGTFSSILFPFRSHLPQVWSRIFPFGRGLFEDYVSNVWCLLNPIFHFRQFTRGNDDSSSSSVSGLFFTSRSVGASEQDILLRTLKDNFATQNVSISSVLLIVELLKLKLFGSPRACTMTLSLCLTFGGAFWSSYSASFRKGPSLGNFLQSLFGSSLSFYLFSWQVHEKAILLPLVIILLAFPLFASPERVTHFLSVALVSLYPLACKDKNEMLFFQLILQLGGIFIITTKFDARSWFSNENPVFRNFRKLVFVLWLCGVFVLFLANATFEAPPQYPDLFVFLLSAACAGYFLLAFFEQCKLGWGLANYDRRKA